MGDFTNIKRNKTINSLIDGQKKRLINPYYVNMRNPTITTYYSINMSKSTLDNGSKLSYSDLGKNSPFKYNKINGLYMFGLERFLIQLDNGEYGLESAPVETEGYILPGTIVPVPNDYVLINSLDKKVLFRILDSTPDTLTNGANMYKLNMKLDQKDASIIDQNVIESFNFIIDNVGTQLKTTIKSDKYNLIETLESASNNLKLSYKELFYSQRVDTFIWKFKNYYNLYDPYMIEFIMKNNLLKNSNFYLFIDQKCGLTQTFGLDYNKTFFRMIEKQTYKENGFLNPIAIEIVQPFSILSSRLEPYYRLDFNGIQDFRSEPIECIDKDLLNHIKNKELYDKNYKNIIIKYFNKEPINKCDISLLDDINFTQDKEFFYNIPIIIYILENQILQIFKNK